MNISKRRILMNPFSHRNLVIAHSYGCIAIVQTMRKQTDFMNGAYELFIKINNHLKSEKKIIPWPFTKEICSIFSLKYRKKEIVSPFSIKEFFMPNNDIAYNLRHLRWFKMPLVQRIMVQRASLLGPKIWEILPNSFKGWKV